MYYMFKYPVGIKKTLLVPSGPKNHFKGYFGKTNFDELVFARNDFFRLVRAPNESLILIILYYMFKYSVGIKTSLL